jgi:hypothetical protein
MTGSFAQQKETIEEEGITFCQPFSCSYFADLTFTDKFVASWSGVFTFPAVD